MATSGESNRIWLQEQQGTVGSSDRGKQQPFEGFYGDVTTFGRTNLYFNTFSQCLGSLKVTTVDLPTPPGENSNAGTPDL